MADLDVCLDSHRDVYINFHRARAKSAAWPGRVLSLGHIRKFIVSQANFSAQNLRALVPSGSPDRARIADSSKNRVWTLSLRNWGKFTYGGQ